MNERLEKEIDRVFFKGENHTNKLMHTELNDIAHHFYNLALEDVRKEVKKHKNLLKREREYTNYAGGRLDEVKNILDFIEEKLG